MNLVTLSCIVGVVSYYFVWRSLGKDLVKQNLATWMLWALLDAIVAASVIYKGGNSPLVVTYVFGSGAIAIAIFRKGTFSWGWTEYGTFCLVIACLITWWYTTAEVATIVSTLAVVIAGVPQLHDGWKKPKEMPFGPYIGFFFANLLSVGGGKDWSIEERFYPTACTIWCLIFVAVVARKYLPTTTPARRFDYGDL